MSAPPIEQPPGRIVTFYSYKGGVGRSMALANVAVILARDYGMKVVAIDWDLEAPGLHRYFGISDDDAGPGVIDYFSSYKDMLTRSPSESMISAKDLDIRRFARTIERYEDGGSIQFISAGDQRDSERYVELVSRFDWDDFYRNWNGAQLIEAVRNQLGQLGDAVLIDSRTGITDTGGICTLHLPDIIVLVFVFNNQNLDGIARIASEVTGNNPAIDIVNRSPEALFLPSRKDVSEIAQLREWEAKAVELFQPYFVSSRITERFGDDALQYLRDASVPYVPYFAYGEELAARTDKGYEMTAPLEILAQMISDRGPMPRKMPKREVSHPLKASAPEPQLRAKIPGPMVWGVVVMGTLALGVSAWLAGKLLDRISINDPEPDQTDSSGQGEGTESGDADPLTTDKLPLFDPQQLRADVRFDYLAFYADTAPALVEAWQCDLALGTVDTAGEHGNWTQDWQLEPIEATLRAVGGQAVGLVSPTAASIESYTYRPFEPLVESGQDPPEFALDHVMELSVQGRVSGLVKTSAWLSKAWEVAESRGIIRSQAERNFRQLYGIAADADLIYDVTPVVASMQLNYGGRPFASMQGWVVRIAGTNELVVRFMPTTPANPSESSEAPARPAVIAEYLEHRNQHAEWVTKIQGVATYTEHRNKRVYRINIEGSVDQLDEIRSVTYSFPDGKTIRSEKSDNKWVVSKSRNDCEGHVGIRIERKDGVTLPLMFSWCEDAVRMTPSSDPRDPTSSCDGKLVAKNPGAAERVCMHEYGAATSEDERRRIAGQLVEIYGRIGSDAEYCEWVKKAKKFGGSLEKQQINQYWMRCTERPPDDPRQHSLPNK